MAYLIIAMTAHALVEERQNCLDAGMSDHVTKPIDPDALLATLLRWAKPRSGSHWRRRSDRRWHAMKLCCLRLKVLISKADSSAWSGTSGSTEICFCSLRQSRPMLPQQIAAAIESGDLKLAERIAHTVKGVAGNLGLRKVLTAAEKLEKAIRHGDAVEAALLEEFTWCLAIRFRPFARPCKRSCLTKNQSKKALRSSTRKPHQRRSGDYEFSLSPAMGGLPRRFWPSKEYSRVRSPSRDWMPSVEQLANSILKQRSRS